jgi:hypothetical protein
MGGCVGECMYIEPGYIHVNFDEVTKTKPMNEKIQRKRATTVIKTEKYRIATRGIESKQASKKDPRLPKLTLLTYLKVS